jgi:hypothetical protein
VRRRLLPLLALVMIAVGTAGPAHAITDDPNVGELRYEGTRVETPQSGTPRTREMDLVFACSGGVCTDDDFFGSFIGGVMEVDLPATGTGCDLENDIRARQGRLELTPEAVTGTVEFLERQLSGCSEGYVRTAGTVITYDLAHDRGEVCLIDATCLDAAPTEEPADEDCCAPPGAPRPFAEPTVYSGLDTVATAATPGNLLWAAVGTVILALLVAIPTHFFNSAAETLSDRVGAWWRRLRARPEATASKRGGWPLAAGGVAAAAVIAAFADPGFGFDAAGVRVLLSILAAFAVEVVLGWVAVILLVRRTHPTASATFRFAPLTLLVVAGAVLLTRLTGFEPPIVFGLVAGVAFGGLLGTAEKARVALLGLGWAFGIGLLAWGGYSILVAAGVDGAGGVFARELLSAAAIAGLSALPIALLPLRGLAGRTVWEASRRVWIAAYAIGLFAFLLVLLPLPASWTEVGFGLWAWIGLYLIYALAALAIWLVVTRPWRREPSDAAV